MLVITTFVLNRLYLKGMKLLNSKGMTKSPEKKNNGNYRVSGQFDLLQSNGDIWDARQET